MTEMYRQGDILLIRVEKNPLNVSAMTDIKEAVAWTFGLKKEEYNPIIET